MVAKAFPVWVVYTLLWEDLAHLQEEEEAEPAAAAVETDLLGLLRICQPIQAHCQIVVHATIHGFHGREPRRLE